MIILLVFHQLINTTKLKSHKVILTDGGRQGQQKSNFVWTGEGVGQTWKKTIILHNQGLSQNTFTPQKMRKSPPKMPHLLNNHH